MINLHKYNHHQFIEFILIFILLIFPKLDLIDIPNYHQGIRIEDLVVVYIAISLYFSGSFEIKRKDFGYFFYIYFFILLASIIHGSLYFNQQWLILPRYVEYIIILIYFNRNNPDLSSIFLILRLYLLLNLIFVILQQFNLIGEFSSLGYESPNQLTDDRPTGLTGGPWELSNSCAIIFFALMLDSKQSNFSKYFYTIVVVYLILATQSRTILVSFILAMILSFYIKNISKKKFYFFIIFLFSLSILLISEIYFQKQFLIKIKMYSELIPLLKNFILNLEKPVLETLDGRLWSMAYRIDHWLIFYKQFLYNPFTIVFGTGSTFIYYESTLLRVLFGTGIFGLLFVVYAVKKIPLHILILFFVSGLSLDLLLSFKIFITMLLYFYIQEKTKYDYRN